MEMNWTDAESHCQSTYGTHLATIHSSMDNANVINTATNAGLSTYVYVWIGYNDIDSEATWVWADGSRSDIYSNWDAFQPNVGTGEDCGVLYYTGYWHDYPCSDKFKFVCNSYSIIQGTCILFKFDVAYGIRHSYKQCHA